jgi:DNA polymerase-3 subunit alpha
VKIAAVVADVRIIITKRSSQEMAFVRAEDDTGSLDLVVFPKIFEKTKSVWIDNMPLLIHGRVDSRDESPTIIVESIETKQSMKDTERLFIKIPKDVKTNQLKVLRNLLIGNPGIQNVTLIFEEKNRKVNLNIKIKWDKELSRNIDEILKT